MLLAVAVIFTVCLTEKLGKIHALLSNLIKVPVTLCIIARVHLSKSAVIELIKSNVSIHSMHARPFTYK